MLSDIENRDIMLGGRHSERKESVDSNLARRPESTNTNLLENNEKYSCLNPRRAGSSDNSGLGQNSTSAISSAEINRLSSELYSRISREMDEMMNSVSVQIQRAISDAIKYCLRSKMPMRPDRDGTTQKRWNVPA